MKKLKDTYTYKVLIIDPSGMATVEYKSETLGSITRVFVIAYDRGEAAVRHRIKEMFPVDLFYSRWLSRSYPLREMDVSSFLVSGKMDVDLEDHFYDVQEEATKAF